MAEYCHNSCSKCPPFSRIHAQDVQYMLLVNCIVSDGLVNAMPIAKHAENAASVHNTCLPSSAIYQKIFNRNRKLKQQVSK